jgi:hypothetical protein
VHFLNGTYHVVGNSGDTITASTTSNKFTTSGTAGSTGTINVDSGVTFIIGAQDSTTASLQTAGSGTAGSSITKSGLGTLTIRDRNNQLDTALILAQGKIDARFPRSLGGIDALANWTDMRNNTTLTLDYDAFSNPATSPTISGADFLTSIRTGDAGETITVNVDRLTAGAALTHAIGAINANIDTTTSTNQNPGAGAFTFVTSPGANMTSGTAGLYLYPSFPASRTTANSAATPAVVLSGNGTFDVRNNTDTGVNMVMTINGGIQGAFGITKAGSGTLVLASTAVGNSAAPLPSTYSGGTTVNAGTLVVGYVNALGSSTAGPGLTINGTATTQLQAGLTGPVQLPGLTITGSASPSAMFGDADLTGLTATNGWLAGDFDVSGTGDNATDQSGPLSGGSGAAAQAAVQPVPEPSTLILAALGVAGVGMGAMRRKRR